MEYADDKLVDCFQNDTVLVERSETLKTKEEGLGEFIRIFQAVPLLS